MHVRTAKRPISAAPGDYVVRTDHPLGTLAVYLLEPESDDGLARWGSFDGIAHPNADFGVYRVVKPHAFETEPLP